MANTCLSPLVKTPDDPKYTYIKAFDATSANTMNKVYKVNKRLCPKVISDAIKKKSDKTLEVTHFVQFAFAPSKHDIGKSFAESALR